MLQSNNCAYFDYIQSPEALVKKVCGWHKRTTLREEMYLGLYSQYALRSGLRVAHQSKEKRHGTISLPCYKNGTRDSE